MKRLIILTLLFLFALNLCLCSLFAQELKLSNAKLGEVFPGADFFVYKEKPFSYYEAYRGQKKQNPKLVGFAFSTYQLFPEEKGYQGPINILAGMNLAGELTGMKILEHSETPSYTGEIYSTQFQSQFIGKTVYQPIAVGEDIDAISQATITSQAITRSIRKSMRLVASEILKFENLPREPGLLDEFKGVQIYLTILLLAAALGAFLSKREALRWVILGVSFGYLGVIKGNFISVVNFVNLANLRLPALMGNLYWYIFFIFVIIITLLWGRVYCGYLCPFGIICALINKLPSQRLNLSFALNKVSSYLKLLILAASILVYLFTKNAGIFNYEVFVTLFTLKGSYMAWLLLAISILAMLSLVSYFWCRFLCPAGAILGLLSRISLFKQKLNCSLSQCRVCSAQCPMGCIDPDQKTIFSPECIRCNICINKCPQKDEKG